MAMLPVEGHVEITCLDLFEATKKFVFPLIHLFFVSQFNFRRLTSYRTIGLQVDVEFGPEVDLGWTSSTTVSLQYGSLLVGEIKLDDTYIMPNKSDGATLTLKDVEIWNMHGFKCFIQHVVPQSRGGYQQRDGGPAVSLEMDERGHQLSLSVRLEQMGFAKALEPRVRRIDDRIAIDFFIENTTKVELLFGQAYFILEQNDRTLANLKGIFNITRWEKRREVSMEGLISSNTTLRGKAVLKGVDVEDEDRGSWYIHAIQLFEMEVDLDETMYGQHFSPRE